jgi:sarcosine oxidase subunit gamma
MVEPTLVDMARAASASAVTLEPVAVHPVFTLRARGDAVSRLAVACGSEALPEPNRVQRLPSGALLCWLRPDEWLLIGDGPAAPDLAAATGEDGAVVDTSGAHAGFILHGPQARDVLASCCPMDTRPRNFGFGQCAQTLIGHVGIFLAPLAENRYLVVCRPSAADYVVRWLADAMVA